MQLGFTVVLNIYTIIALLYGFWGIRGRIINPTALGLSLCLGLMFIEYLLFIHKSRYKLIIKTYKKEIFSDRKGNILVLIYFIGSVILFGLGIFTMAARNNGLL
jgi:hypothetical protein